MKEKHLEIFLKLYKDQLMKSALQSKYYLNRDLNHLSSAFFALNLSMIL
jgi:hypothetical protein